MIISLRVITALILCLLYFLIFTQSVDWFSAFNQAHADIFNPPEHQQYGLNAARNGMIIIYTLALVSIVLVAYPHEESRWGFLGLFLAMITFISMAGFY